MTTFIEITQQWEAFFADVEANQGTLTPELEQRHECLQLSTAEKVDGYIYRLDVMEGQVEQLRVLAQQVTQRKASIEQSIEYLKTRVRFFMEANGKKHLPGAVLTGFKLVPAGGERALELLVEDSRAFPMELLDPPTVNKAKVKAVLGKEGAGITLKEPVYDIVTMEVLFPAGTPLARLKPRGEVLRRYV